MIKVTQQSVPSLVQWYLQEVEKQKTKAIQFIWTGQAGFLFKTREFKIGIDLYLSDSLAKKYQGTAYPHSRMMPPPINSTDLMDLDILLCTHGHTDHMDKETLLPLFLKNKGPLLIAPRFEIPKLLEMGIPPQQIVGMNEAEKFSPFTGFTITAIPSAHDIITYDQWENTKALGFFLDFGSVRFYHSGDSVEYPLLKESLRMEKPDICMLPVNGRKQELTEKGVIGNFTIREAGQLAKFSKASLLIPHHFGMFDFNTVDPAEIGAELKSQGWKLDETFIIPRLNTVYTVSNERG